MLFLIVLEVFKILNCKGVVFSKLRREEDAIINFNKATIVLWLIVKEVSTFPKSEGGLLRKIGRRVDALIDFNKAIAIDPGYVYAYFNRGRFPINYL